VDNPTSKELIKAARRKTIHLINTSLTHSAQPKSMLILASSSPTRKSLLTRAGIVFEALTPPIDEAKLQVQTKGQNSTSMAQRLADAKAISISHLYPQTLVIGADQTLFCNNIIYHKPVNRNEAKQQLQELKSKTHQLNSALSCAHNGKIIWRFQDKAELTMRSFSEEFLETYLDKAEDDILTSVGSYKLEGIGIQLFEDIKGDYFTILGFPLPALMKFLRTRDLLPS
jgi:septum formation protein